MEQFNIQRKVIDASGDQGLRLAVEIYTPKHISAPKLNILLAHANGYHKEVWYPIISRLPHIEACWIAYDIRNQGDSALLNAGKLGSDDCKY
jgi:hypothetical protein